MFEKGVHLHKGHLLPSGGAGTDHHLDHPPPILPEGGEGEGLEQCVCVCDVGGGVVWCGRTDRIVTVCEGTLRHCAWTGDWLWNVVRPDRLASVCAGVSTGRGCMKRLNVVHRETHPCMKGVFGLQWRDWSLQVRLDMVTVVD